MEKKLSNNDFIYSVNDSDNIILILYNMIMYAYDGKQWAQIYISDNNLPNTDFSLLKRPGIAEIPVQFITKSSSDNYAKCFVISGGFIPNSKTFCKTVYLLLFKKNVNKENGKEIITYD